MTTTTFRVTEAFKGTQVGAIVQVGHSSGSSATCGIQFEAGETHTLAAYQTATPRSAWHQFVPGLDVSAACPA